MTSRQPGEDPWPGLTLTPHDAPLAPRSPSRQPGEDPWPGLTFACATRTEERAARRLRARTALVGIGARRELPDGPVVSFGLAGGLHHGLTCGEVLDATRVVDADGTVLWEGSPLGAPGARQGTILAVDAVVDDPAERRRLHERTGADAVDMESGALARSGRLAGCLRAISDTPDRTLGPLAQVLDGEGRLRPAGIARALAAPRRTGRALADVRGALRNLERVSP
jgi:Phosphorylase superfamily